MTTSTPPARADLVLEGGGVRGIGLVGAVLELADAGWVFPRIGATSAGAVVGALTAAYQQAGAPLDRLVDDLDESELEALEAGDVPFASLRDPQRGSR